MEPLRLSELAGDLPRPGVLCTLAKVVGSAPQAPGAKMYVWKDGFQGTIGGGKFEAEVLSQARLFLSAAQPEASPREYTLCREMGQCCGGKCTVFFEPAPRKRAVHVFGAGHVGRALASALHGMDLEVVVVDERKEWADPAAFPAGTKVLAVEPIAVASAAKYGELDAACVLTHDHALDFKLIDLLLQKPLGYVGLIGSDHKARTFRARLPAPRREAWDERMHCPIGRRVPTKNPKAIAVAIAAQLLEEWACKAPAEPARTAA